MFHHVTDEQWFSYVTVRGQYDIDYWLQNLLPSIHSPLLTALLYCNTNKKKLNRPPLSALVQLSCVRGPGGKDQEKGMDQLLLHNPVGSHCFPHPSCLPVQMGGFVELGERREQDGRMALELAVLCSGCREFQGSQEDLGVGESWVQSHSSSSPFTDWWVWGAREGVCGSICFHRPHTGWSVWKSGKGFGVQKELTPAF